ncbi:hypothetical protein C7B62_13240 [Pleurocapsa sp. CCALA 161]|uniref:hypothetical protein n=1 Tax=Pleurocapsa sp. CCALA 161 TaxID=2107688 RepID=UPI000D061B58|nr:hypothetical protein [Pleurocapsa sp. CCALA 161]PSB09414.1 hypothetical protein C7B62_13240 [Pleurocapsa sp. CCALA 161]
MAEDNKPNGTQAKATTTNSKTTQAKTTADKSSSVSQTTAKEGGEQVLALSTQPRTLLPQNRPIEPSSLEVVHTYSSVGSDRPVSKGTVKFSSSLTISGNRPIAASTLQVSESYMVMGNRPVASNESDETGTLMGYLD